MSRLRVLVVGASIAGPTVAYWLAKAGAEVTVIERYPDLRTSGQAIDIRTAGVTVMRKMLGMEAAVRAKATTLQGMSLVRDDGRPYGVIRATGNPDQQSLVSEYEIFRGDLAKILFDLTRDNENITYRFREQVVAIHYGSAEDGPIKVEFKNGLPTSEFDLVVACDGATSRTRAIGFQCGVRDHIEPTNMWAAYFSIGQDLLNGGKIGLGHSAIGGRFVTLGPDPSGVTRASLYSIHSRSNPDATLPFREAAKGGDETLKQYIANRFEGTKWRTNEILDAMMDSQDFYASEIVQVKVPSLYKGRFVMVGDAGYAAGPTGGGTSLAMAGAYLLAGEIVKHKGDLAAGLAGYAEPMKPLMSEMQKIPPFVPGVMAPQTAWGLWLRNTIFTFITRSGLIDFIQKYFAGAFASIEEHKLPEYEWVA